LHRAWELGVQEEAMEKASELFRGTGRPDDWAPTVTIDEETGQAAAEPAVGNDNHVLDDDIGTGAARDVREQRQAEQVAAELARRRRLHERDPERRDMAAMQAQRFASNAAFNYHSWTQTQMRLFGE
jgi:hypothetical protein